MFSEFFQAIEDLELVIRLGVHQFIGEKVEPEKFQHPIAFNLFSHDSQVGDDGYNEEERKLTLESRKILGQPDLAISATCSPFSIATTAAVATTASRAAATTARVYGAANRLHSHQRPVRTRQ